MQCVVDFIFLFENKSNFPNYIDSGVSVFFFFFSFSIEKQVIGDTVNIATKCIVPWKHNINNSNDNNDNNNNNT